MIPLSRRELTGPTEKIAGSAALATVYTRVDGEAFERLLFDGQRRYLERAG